MKKTCTKCGELKEIEWFSKDKKRNDGLVGTCKICVRKSGKLYRSKNKEKIAEKRKTYFFENKEKMTERSRAYCSKYFAKNKEKIAKKNKTYCSENKERFKAHRSKNKGKMAEYNKTYCINLNDNYIRRVIVQQYNMAVQDITPEMIEAKRQIILMCRGIKEVNDGINGAKI